jgi:hypothetical protein
LDLTIQLRSIVTAFVPPREEIGCVGVKRALTPSASDSDRELPREVALDRFRVALEVLGNPFVQPAPLM